METLEKPSNLNSSNGASREVCDGTLRITIQGGSRNGQEFDLDVVSAKLAMEIVEVKHGAGNKSWTVTPEFLADLSTALLGVGVEHCTPTMAYQLWQQVTNVWLEVKKNISL